MITIAGTGAGKSLIFAMLAIAAELANFQGIVVVICPLKSLQKDQVGPLTELEKHSQENLCILGEEVQQHTHSFVVRLQQAGQVICSCYQ